MSKRKLSATHRQMLRWGVIHLATPEQEAVLLGQYVHELPMGELEAYCELLFGSNLRHHAPPEYRRRPGAAA
jgi:hypothetical protein